MYGLCTIVVLLSAAVYTNAATALFLAEEKPAELADEEGCYMKHLNKVIPYGDYFPEKSCTKYYCSTSNITQVFTCGTQYIDEGGPCHLVDGDLTKDYPECCPWVMCSTFPPEALAEDTTASVLEETTQDFKIEVLSETKPDEGPEILVAQASLNQ